MLVFGGVWIPTHGMLLLNELREALDALRVIHYQSPLVFGGEGDGIWLMV